MADMDNVREADGHDHFRVRDAKELSALVQARIKSLQNPADYPTARKLVCNLNKGCGYGYGCQLHHALYCFIGK